MMFDRHCSVWLCIFFVLLRITTLDMDCSGREAYATDPNMTACSPRDKEKLPMTLRELHTPKTLAAAL